MLGGSDKGSYFIPQKITTSEFVYPKKSLLTLAYPKKSLSPFFATQKNPSVFFSQPRKIPVSFIDPKKSLLAKISDPKKSLVLNLLIGRNCINFVAGGSHTGRMYYPPPSSSHPLPSDHVRQIPGFVRDSDTDRDSRASAESSGGSSPSMPHGEQQQVPHPGSQQMLYHGTPHQSVQTAGVCTTPGKVTPTYVAICFGNPNIF